MRTCLGVASHLAARHVNEQRIKDSEWLFIEGYVFANPDTGQTAILEAIRVAKQHGTKIALTCSDAFVPQVFAAPFNSALQHAELLFCNETEACSITGGSDAEDAFKKLKGSVPSVVVTNGPHGAYIRYGGIEAHVPAFPSEPKDLTGAGDMFAGSFLYGITHGIPADDAARAASFLSHKVISQVGARLHQGTRQFWDECLASV
jgi:sugar/nucleoside kinase (ribokinase family)